MIDTTATLGTAPAVATESNLDAINTNETLASYNICKSFETTCSNPLRKGWYMNFKNTAGDDDVRDEEKLVSAPRVISGMVLFGTNTPRRPIQMPIRRSVRILARLWLTQWILLPACRSSTVMPAAE